VNADRPHQLYFAGDTVVDGVDAKVMLQRLDGDYVGYRYDAFPFDTILVRQEGEKFYQYLDTAFRVLYDFSLELGDTISVYVPEDLRNQNPDISHALYRIDSVETITVDGQELKGQFWTWVSTPSFVDGALAEGWRYELLGTINGYLLPYGGFFCDGRCPRFLRCFSSPGGDGGAGLTYADPNFPFPCDTVISSTREPDIGHLIRLGPNPVAAGQTLTVTLDESLSGQEVSVLLVDATGRRVAIRPTLGVATLQLEVPATAPAGLYTLILQTPEGRAALRLIVVPSG
jgi:hypothetical protein